MSEPPLAPPEPAPPASTPPTPAPPTGGTTLYFAAAFGITWLALLPAVLAQRGLIAGPVERYLPLGAVAVLGPMLAGILAARLEPGGAGVRGLFRPLRLVRVGAIWYLVALALPGAILAAGLAIHAVVTARDPGPLVYPPAVPQGIVAMVIVSFGEEIGWRGFALPRLQRRHGALAGSVILGVLWAVWHLPMMLLANIDTPLLLATMIPFFTAGSVVFTWIVNHARGSLLVAVCAHMGAHLSNSHQPLPGNATPLVLHTIGYVVVAAAVVLVDRRLWRAPSPVFAPAV